MEALEIRTNEELAELGRNLVASGCFPDTGTAAQAVVKILAGAELGLPPIDAMRSFHVMADGRITPSAALLARAIKASGRYDYRVSEFTNEACELVFFEREEEAGRSRFTMDDARGAGLVRDRSTWAKQPRNMLFNRALTNGVAWFAPDVLVPENRESARVHINTADPELAGDSHALVASGVELLAPASTTADPEAYGEGAEEEAEGERTEAGGAERGEKTSQPSASPPPAHPGPHVWARGEHGLAYCRLEGCFATVRIGELTHVSDAIGVGEE